jgi:hypothetical protein
MFTCTHEKTTFLFFVNIALKQAFAQELCNDDSSDIPCFSNDEK